MDTHPEEEEFEVDYEPVFDNWTQKAPHGFTDYDRGALHDSQIKKLDEFQSKLRRENEEYLARHPELRVILTEFISELVKEEPINVAGFGAEYFLKKFPPKEGDFEENEKLRRMNREKEEEEKRIKAEKEKKEKEFRELQHFLTEQHAGEKESSGSIDVPELPPRLYPKEGESDEEGKDKNDTEIGDTSERENSRNEIEKEKIESNTEIEANQERINSGIGIDEEEEKIESGTSTPEREHLLNEVVVLEEHESHTIIEDTPESERSTVNEEEEEDEDANESPIQSISERRLSENEILFEPDDENFNSYVEIPLTPEN